MSDRERAKQIFLDALERASEERAAYLDEACGGNAQLRAGVERLLAAESQASSFLGGDTPAPPIPWTPSQGLSVDLGPGDRVGPYKIARVLGEGGFGVVFEASQEEPVRRRVALKIVKLGMDTVAVTGRFEAERQALALMDHPNIARVYDAGTTDSGRPYFVMELVDGVPITRYADREALGLRDRLALFRTVCQAVQHAHQKGVLHRDLKPSNVLVATVDGRPEPKVIDFGVAKATGARLTEETVFTQEGYLVGTPAYMSPEQAEGALDIDIRADVYSLGVVLYELLSGVPPFDMQSLGLQAVFQAIREEEPPRPSTRRLQRAASAGPKRSAEHLDVPRELDWIVMRCLEKERGRRYATAHDLAGDIGRFLADEPVEAAPPSALYRARKLVRRNRAAALAVAGVSAALVVGAIGTTVGLVRAERMNTQLGEALEETSRAKVRLESAFAEKERANRRLDGALDETESANLRLDAALAGAEAANLALDAALTESRRQTAIAEAVNAFLTDDLLAGARPTGSADRGPDAPIGVLLDRAATSLDLAASSGGRFAGEPLVEAALRYTIGVTYETLGLYPQATRHLERCADLRRAGLGAGDAATLSALSYLGKVQKRQGLFAEAAETQREAYAGLRALHGVEHLESLMSAVRLVTVLREVGRSDEAFELLQELVPIAREAHGERAPVTTDLCARLAIQYTDRGRLEEAEELFRLVLDAQAALLGAENPVALNAKVNLATLLRATHRYSEAEALYREALAVQRRVEGTAHPNTLNTLFNLTECLRSLERYEEARALLTEAIPAAERAYGENHPRTLGWLTVRARLAETLNDYETAETIHRDVWERHTRYTGPDHEMTLSSANDLAALLLYLERPDEAGELFYRVLDGNARANGDDDPRTIAARRRVGVFHRRAGELADARRQLEAAHEAAVRTLGPGHLLTLECAASLAAVCADQDEIEHAQSLAEGSAALAELEAGTSRAAWLSAADRLAAACERAGDMEAAEHWRQVVTKTSGE